MDRKWDPRLLRPALHALIILPPAIYVYPLRTVEEARTMHCGQSG